MTRQVTSSRPQTDSRVWLRLCVILASCSEVKPNLETLPQETSLIMVYYSQNSNINTSISHYKLAQTQSTDFIPLLSTWSSNRKDNPNSNQRLSKFEENRSSTKTLFPPTEASPSKPDAQWGWARCCRPSDSHLSKKRVQRDEVLNWEALRSR